MRKLSGKGLPDLLVWLPRYLSHESGWPHLIECKTKKAKLRETQDWETLGLRVDVLRTADEALQWNPE